MGLMGLCELNWSKGLSGGPWCGLVVNGPSGLGFGWRKKGSKGFEEREMGLFLWRENYQHKGQKWGVYTYALKPLCNAPSLPTYFFFFFQISILRLNPNT